jgi:hypothetical protein
LIWRSCCGFWSVFIKKHETLSLVDLMLRRRRVSAPQPQAAAAACLGA